MLKTHLLNKRLLKRQHITDIIYIRSVWGIHGFTLSRGACWDCWEGKGRYGSFRLRIERMGVQVKLWDPTVRSLENTCHLPECFSGDDSRTGAISSVCTSPYLTYCFVHIEGMRSDDWPFSSSLLPVAEWKLPRTAVFEPPVRVCFH